MGYGTWEMGHGIWDMMGHVRTFDTQAAHVPLGQNPYPCAPQGSLLLHSSTTTTLYIHTEYTQQQDTTRFEGYLAKGRGEGGWVSSRMPAPIPMYTHEKMQEEWVDPCHIGIGRLETRRDLVWGKLHTYSDEPRTCRSRVPNQSRIPGSQGGSPWHVASQYTYAQNLSEDTRSYSCNVPH